MGEYYELRITRYRDSQAFEQVVDLMAKLFPERSRDEFAAALAVTPVQLTQQASQRAAAELEAALTGMGATVTTRKVEQGTSSEFGTIEVTDDFIVKHRQMRDASSDSPTTAEDSAVVKPPWEDG